MKRSMETILPLTTKDVLKTLPPFPVVLVTTRTNIITIGQIEYLTLSPLRIGIAVAHSRYTYSLLKSEREFVVNVPEANLLPAVRICGSISGRDHNKFEAAGLTPVPSIEVKAAGIEECGAQIECVVEREVEFEERTWFIGKVVAARKRPGHDGTKAILCGRTEYSLPGEVIGPR